MMDNNMNNLNDEVLDSNTEKTEISNDEPQKEVSQVADNAFKEFINNPTVEFSSVVPEQSNNSSGIKVFFSILAVTVALVMAVSVGFIFGKSNGKVNSDFKVPDILLSGNETYVESDCAGVYNNVNDSVVSITIYNLDGIGGYASGVVFTSDGYIVTNDHIYSNVKSAKFLVTFADGTEFPAQFVAGDTRSDLAVLKVDATGLKPATFVSTKTVAVGEKVIAIGYPSGADESSVLTSGIISSAGIRVRSSSTSYTMKMIQTDTAINPGSSGGALVNMYSQVVGITSAKMVGSEYDSIGYAIPTDTVISVVSSLITKGYVEGRGRLGLTYTEVNTVTAELENCPRGLLVQTISADSDLFNKGIEQGDIITHINDIEIIKSDIALDIIESTEPGVPMSFTIYSSKDGTSKTIYASLIADRGSSSYTNDVISGTPSSPFEDEDDVFSDH